MCFFGQICIRIYQTGVCQDARHEEVNAKASASADISQKVNLRMSE